MTERAFLSVRWTPATAVSRVGGFIRYVSFRDHHRDLQGDRRLEGLLRYVAHRDPTATRSRVFDREGPAGDRARSELLRFVQRSASGRATGARRRPERVVYRFVLSPERAQGLDLKRLTRAAMHQLERDAGGLGPWIAAEHRNTRHPHVHIILAAKREVEPGRHRSVVVTRQRLARMKLALAHDIERQREGRPRDRDWQPAPKTARGRHSARDGWRPRTGMLTAGLGWELSAGLRAAITRAARRYRWEAEREGLQREREGGWER